MPQKIGKLTADVDLNLRPATQQWNRFQQSIRRGGGRDSLFGAISGDAREFENSLGKATNRVVAFGAAAAIFTAIARATSEFAKSIVEVDKQLAAINVNLGQSADGLKKFGADLFNVARQTGQTFEVAAGAAAELARQGLSAEETTKRLKDALMLSRIAGLDSASAVNTLTAAINSFNAEALTSSEVVNKFAAVDTKFAVSSKDLAEAVSRVGSTAQTAGVGLNELIGLVTSLQQTTARGGATIGNGLKTIFTRIQAAPETVNALQGIGVAIKNTDGSLRDGISILKDYASARQKVGEAERQALDRTVAGTFQINVLKALLGDLSKEYSVYGNAVRTASGATDEAIRKNEQLNQTISSLLNSTGLSIKQLFSSIGDKSLSGLFKQILQELDGFRSFFSGESGNEWGKSLGDGILSGISNVLTGPAITAIWLILTSTFKKVIGTVLQEAGTLLRINSAVQARANIQKQINNLLGQATQAELAQYQAANSVLAKKEQILAIEARINQERLVGSAVGNSLLVPGPLGVGLRKDPKMRGGYLGKIPGMANPIASAIAREQKASGLPRKDIYVDRDSRVATFANPMGLLVANKRDEPLGGFQGVNRVIGEGGNPKIAGTTPNFAPLKSQRDIIQERFGLKKTYEGAAQTAVQIAMASTDGVTASAQKLESTILMLDKAFIPLIKAAKTEAAFKAALYGPKTYGNTTQSFADPEQRQFSGDGGYAATFLAQSQRKSRPQQPFGPAFPINPDLRERLESSNLARQGIVPGSAYSTPIGPPDRVTFAREQALRQSTLRQRMQSLVAEKKNATLQATMAADQERLAKQEQRRQSRQNKALGAAFILPFLAGSIDPLAKNLGINTGGGTTGGRITGALGGAAQGAGIGGIFGPTGLAVGAGIGALVGAFSKLKKSTEEIAAEFDEQASARGRENDALSRAIQLQEQLSDALKEGADASTVERIERQLREARGATGSGRAIFDIKDPLARNKAQAEKLDKDARDLAINDVILAFSKKGVINAFNSKDKSLQADNSSFVTSLKKAITDEGFNSISNEQIRGLQGLAAKNYDVPFSFIGDSDVDAANSGKQFAEATKATEDFKEAMKTLTPILEKFGVTAGGVNQKNIQGTIIDIVRALGEKRADIEADAEAKRQKEASRGRLAPGAFTNSPNLDIYRNAALTGRSPLANRGDKARAQFDLFEELKGSKAPGFNEIDLKGNELYQKATAGLQAENIGDALIKYLQTNNSMGGGLRDARGNPNLDSIQRTLEIVSKSGAANAETVKQLLGIIPALKNNLADAKVNTISGPMSNQANFSSGFAPGVGYGNYNKIGKRAFRRFDANGNPILTQVPNAPAAGRNSSLSQATLDALPSESQSAQQNAAGRDADIQAYLKIAQDSKDAAQAAIQALQQTLKIIVTVNGSGNPETLAAIQRSIQALYNNQAADRGAPNPPSIYAEVINQNPVGRTFLPSK